MKKTILLVAMLAMALVGAVPAMAQEGAKQFVSGDQSNAPPDAFDGVILGTITNISGSVVFVEADPSVNSGDKGFFTVTDETEITKRKGGESLPATLEDLEVGQMVEAAYDGEFATSDPPQGKARSIAILEEDGDTEKVSATFELAVECELPEGLDGFSGEIGSAPIAYGALLDEDGDGVYSLSLPVEKGTRHGVRIERLDLVNGEVDVASTLEDFGSVVFDEDKAFEASVSFCDDGDDPGDGGESTMPGPDNDGSDKRDDEGGGTRVTRVLPATGGALFLPLGAGALVVGGLLARRLFAR